MGSVLLGVLLFGKLLVVLGLIASAICTIIVLFVVEDIIKTIRIKKERRGLH
jgi:isoprenylcysteine carboxyl methyltransferase (ICMT) family protein YpbQ